MWEGENKSLPSKNDLESKNLKHLLITLMEGIAIYDYLVKINYYQ